MSRRSETTPASPSRVLAMASVCRVGFAALFMSLFALGCGGSSTSEEAAGSATTPTTAPSTTEAVEADETSTSESTTSESATSTSTTTTTTSTTVPEPADDPLHVPYCAAMDDLDAFLDAESPDADAFESAITEQREALTAIEAPVVIADAHETVSTALIEFFTLLGESGELDDAQFDTIFSTPSFVRSSLVIEQYREANCPGQTADDPTDAIVSGLFDFEVGRCMNESPTGDFDEAACDSPHDYQIYHVFDVADADAYPGSSTIDLEAEPACIAAFEPFIGKSYATSIYYVTLLKPSPESWDNGDREVVCLVTAEAGQLTRDLEGVAE